MTESILLQVALIFVLGVGAQWLAWRFRMPSILLLLLFGFLAGPVSGLLSRESLQGEWLFAFVSVAVGIILFEGGLSLELSQLRGTGQAVVNLVSIGVLITWGLAACAAYFLLELNLSLSLLLGAILTVTGPTVVIPLLRHVRPERRVETMARWEGITIDPVGASLSVLVLETVMIVQTSGSGENDWQSAVIHVAEGLSILICLSVGVSIIATAVLITMLRRRLIPDYLQNSVALMIVVAAFALSNVLQEESGLLTTTLMGVIMANQPWVQIRKIIEFKEDLSVLLLAGLFILLSARLEPDVLAYLGVSSLIFLGVLMLVIRPVAVIVSLWPTGATWRETAFLSWLAPRGIVAAAVVSLFSFDLQSVFPGQVERLVPIVFMVIFGTVMIYGISLAPLARYLGLADPDPQGVLILGAHKFALEIAKTLEEIGFKVLLVDSDRRRVRRARESGLTVQRGNPLTETIIDQLDLSGLGRMLAMTESDEVNSLAALHFGEVFESSEIFQLSTESLREGQTGWGEFPKHLRGHTLFGEETTFAKVEGIMNDGGEVRTIKVGEKFDFSRLKQNYPEELIPLFLVRKEKRLYVYAEDERGSPQPGDSVVLLVSQDAARELKMPESLGVGEFKPSEESTEEEG